MDTLLACVWCDIVKRMPQTLCLILLVSLACSANSEGTKASTSPAMENARTDNTGGAQEMQPTPITRPTDQAPTIQPEPVTESTDEAPEVEPDPVTRPMDEAMARQQAAHFANRAFAARKFTGYKGVPDPFRPKDFRAELQGDRWVLSRQPPAGPSADVSFDMFGSHEKVSVGWANR